MRGTTKQNNHDKFLFSYIFIKISHFYGPLKLLIQKTKFIKYELCFIQTQMVDFEDFSKIEIDV